MKYIIYDIETYPNIFLIELKDPQSFSRWVFEISLMKNEIRELVGFLMSLKSQGSMMVGFNNLAFDYPVIHFIIQNQHTVTCLDIYKKANQIINTDWDNRFAHIIWDRDQLVPQVDLLKVHHFDNVARATGLKVLEFNMRMDNIEDLPYTPGSMLKCDEIKNLLSYLGHDITATTLFFQHSLPALEFRETLSKKYERNLMNFNDTKIGKDYLINKLEDHMPGCCYDTSNGSRKPRQTFRDVIHFKDIVFPYVQFDHPEFRRVHQWFLDTSINGGMTKNAFELSCMVRGFQFDFGTGGIHGSVEPQIVVSDDEWMIEDWDVASYYPNLGIRNKVFPEHLSDRFCDIYEEVYNERKLHKKGTPENAALKLALNGTYGDSNNVYSPLYDPQYTMTITINGQLLLCMLAEKLMACQDVQMIQINTDGLTIRYPRRFKEWAHSVCKWWEGITRLELEDNEYKRMFVRDVNNYIGEYVDGKLKRKGAYCHQWNPQAKDRDVEWHQNHSALVVPKAAEAHLVQGVDVRTFIENHSDIFDFMLRVKVPRNSCLVVVDYDGNEEQVQNVTRYHISSFGHDLVKIMPPTAGQIKKDPNAPDRRFNINKGWKVTVCNNMKNAVWDNIDYEWYIQEAMKLIKPLKK